MREIRSNLVVKNSFLWASNLQRILSVSHLECNGDDHGTIGWFELEEMLKTILFQPPAMGRDTLIHCGCLINARKDSHLITIQPSRLKVGCNKSITGAVGLFDILS